MKNKISTLGYFMKRLRDSKYVVWKIFNDYNIGDPRKWTVLVNPGHHSVYITCHVNQESLVDKPVFSFDDGKAWGVSDNIRLQTVSMEVVIRKLMEYDIIPESDLYLKSENSDTDQDQNV